jgi:ABC-type spermidine/putrescine transport system permease subunit II
MAGGAFLVILVVAVGFPGACAAWEVAAGLWRDGPETIPGMDVALFARSVLAALTVAALATCIAWPVAWAGRNMPARWAPMLAMPMLLPTYLSYAALNQLRAPGTWLGDWLMRGPEGVANVKPLIAARACAVIGMVLWAWPLAALVLMARFRRLDRSVLETLRLEPAGPLARSRMILGMTRWSLAAAVGLVMLVMVGSAVPFHLAQLNTYAIKLWRALDEYPPPERWRAWAASWPLLAIAGAGGCVAALSFVNSPRGRDRESNPQGRERTPLPVRMTSIAIWSVSILGPAILFAGSLDGWHSLRVFLHGQHAALIGSAVTSMLTASSVGVLSLATWGVLSARGRFPGRLASACLIPWLAAGLIPGILVGSTTAWAWNLTGWTACVADTSAVVVFGHVARFGFVGVLLGWWMFRSDPLDELDLRRLDGADTPVAWARTALMPQLPILVGGSIAAGMLSFHEIEAAIFLQPPGGGRFSQVMLELLHYERRSDLSAAVVTVMAIGLLGALAAAAVLSRGRTSGAAP